jgi:protoheme IX farnesyltransferase
VRLAVLVSTAVFAAFVTGLNEPTRTAGLAFTDWPLVNGRLVPALEGVMTPMFAHRVAAAVAGLLLLWFVIRARTAPSAPRAVVVLSTVTAVLFAFQMGVGAAITLSGAAAVRGAHAVVAAAIGAMTVALLVSTVRVRAPRLDGRGADGASTPRWRQRAGAYVALTKPRIIELLLVTTVPAMVLAERGVPPLGLAVCTLVGGSMAAGSANAINCYLDRDIDEVMRRTRRRPLPTGVVGAEEALRFGFVLGAVSFFFLSITVNVLAASLALSAIAFYVFVYTLWLKRTSTQNIVIGGAAGAVPALVGWAAVTGTVAPPAWVLFGIVFVWTPPHFWALAMQYRSDYEAAGVPMLPVVRGEEETRRQILMYSLVLFAATMLLVPVGHMGWVYSAAAAVLGGTFVHRALRLWRRPSPALAVKLFHLSILYLGLLFAAVAVDAVLSPR